MSIRGRVRMRTRLRSVIHHIWPPKPKPLILMYHRIADDPVNYWGLAVSPARFEEQLRVLRRTRCPLPLTDFVYRLMAGTLPPNAVALTFDDGYVDNLVAGKPLLVAADMPATVFVTTGYVDHAEGFWWDELASLILLENGPPSFELVISGESLGFDFQNEAPARKDGTSPAGSLKRRRAALWTLRQALRPLEDKNRRLIMFRLRLIFGVGANNASLGRVMNREEVRALATDGLVTIGAHTVTHPVLTGLGTAACLREVIESKHTCEALIGAPVLSFAYPYGDYDDKTREAVKTAGFTIACSTRQGSASATSDIFALPRLYVSDWDGDTFELALRSTSVVNPIAAR